MSRLVCLALLSLLLGVTNGLRHGFSVNTTHATVNHPFIATCSLVPLVPPTGPLTVRFHRGYQVLVEYTFPKGPHGAPKIVVNPKPDDDVTEGLKIRPLSVKDSVYKVEITPLEAVTGTYYCETQQDRLVRSYELKIQVFNN